MKAGLLIVGLTLAASASAQIRHGRRHGHQHKERGDNVVRHTQLDVSNPRSKSLPQTNKDMANMSRL